MLRGKGKCRGSLETSTPTGNGWKYNVTLFADQETRGRRGDHALDGGRRFLPPPSSWEASQVPKKMVGLGYTGDAGKPKRRGTPSPNKFGGGCELGSNRRSPSMLFLPPLTQSQGLGSLHSLPWTWEGGRRSLPSECPAPSRIASLLVSQDAGLQQREDCFVDYPWGDQQGPTYSEQGCR